MITWLYEACFLLIILVCKDFVFDFNVLIFKKNKT